VNIRLASALLLASASALAGCGPGNFPLDSWTPGQEGRATFAYNCFFYCDTSDPLMAGTQETVYVDGGLPAGLVFTSDAPAVLSVGQAMAADEGCSCPDGSSCSASDPQAICLFSYTVTIQAVSPGQARLVARTADGSLFDALPLRVSAPASLAFHCSADNAATDHAVTSLTISRDCSFSVDALDAQSNVLRASSGFSITSADPTVVHVRSTSFLDIGGPDTQPDAPVTDSYGTLNVAGPGSTQIDVKAGAVSLTIPVTVP
jgi:hypothetical protein